MHKPMTDKELVELIDARTKIFKGQLNELEAAIGTLMIGRHYGWKPILLIHDKQTLKKYEAILNIDFREVLPEEGKLADKSVAWLAVKKIRSFWKAVKGEIPGIRSHTVE